MTIITIRDMSQELYNMRQKSIDIHCLVMQNKAMFDHPTELLLALSNAEYHLNKAQQLAKAK